MESKRRTTLCLLGTLLALALLCTPSRATWSVQIVDTSTGEIAVAQVTCIVGPDLKSSLAVVLPGIGGACVQAWWDNDGSKRRIIWDELLQGTDPDAIIPLIQANNYQFGIVDLQGRAATFTGPNTLAWSGGVAGSHGTLAWAIQGNVLANQNVVLAAERAILDTPGTLADKLVASMLAAGTAGGDKRCSCGGGGGCPPPGFDLDTGKSGHVGFMIVARYGDRRGGCSRNGCAQGDYYMEFNVTPGQQGLPDPVVEMLWQFQAWRKTLDGRPDHLHSVATLQDPSLPGNGTAVTFLEIDLKDHHGLNIATGGHTVSVKHDTTSDRLSRIRKVVDHGDGTYAVKIKAGAGQGVDRFLVQVDDGISKVHLYPLPQLVLEPTLFADTGSLPAANGGMVNLDLLGPEAGATGVRPYLVLASASGTSPGTPFGDVVLPLNYDGVFAMSYLLRNTGPFEHTAGWLDPNGEGRARFVAAPGVLFPMIGLDLAFAFATSDRWDFASNPVLVRVDP